MDILKAFYSSRCQPVWKLAQIAKMECFLNINILQPLNHIVIIVIQGISNVQNGGAKCYRLNEMRFNCDVNLFSNGVVITIYANDWCIFFPDSDATGDNKVYIRTTLSSLTPALSQVTTNSIRALLLYYPWRR